MFLTLQLSSTVEQHGYSFVGINVSYVIFVFYDMNELFRLHMIIFAYGADENKGSFIVHVICRAMSCIITIDFHMIQVQLRQDGDGALPWLQHITPHAGAAVAFGNPAWTHRDL